ncbi:hypothetical protein G3O06_07580 [Burkholderia sp. Ac-20345]|uniref:hypothetical protein n=1 Tax=Burkholderia sp. Ac-20345 TaxID=2703891 RepID=UPI00197B96BF|nr:hypothetical protein [Burkholderia sp. Ac-20345]MBN3777411.1 hypothetical protein [Burkholderia sp. Ac-20345]
MTINLSIVGIAWLLAGISLCRLNLRTAAGQRASFAAPIALFIASLLALYVYVAAGDGADDMQTERTTQTIRGGA